MLLGIVCTAMGTEAMKGTADSFNEFIQRIRPHPGQVSFSPSKKIAKTHSYDTLSIFR